VAVSVSTHVLDTERGRPGAHVHVELYRDGDLVAGGQTDGDGRIGPLAEGLEPGAYRLVFHPPSPYFRRVELELQLDDGHHHVPLLVSSFGCVSYRGT
jgi:5-hydroxyisourate hydrolase